MDRKAYKLITPEGVVLRLEDSSFIPFDPDNRDYRAYEAWLAEGNAPEPPDPG